VIGSIVSGVLLILAIVNLIIYLTKKNKYVDAIKNNYVKTKKEKHIKTRKFSKLFPLKIILLVAGAILIGVGLGLGSGKVIPLIFGGLGMMVGGIGLITVAGVI
jgi:high-affinity nickel permease